MGSGIGISGIGIGGMGIGGSSMMGMVGGTMSGIGSDMSAGMQQYPQSEPSGVVANSRLD